MPGQNFRSLIARKNLAPPAGEPGELGREPTSGGAGLPARAVPVLREHAVVLAKREKADAEYDGEDDRSENDHANTDCDHYSNSTARFRQTS